MSSRGSPEPGKGHSNISASLTNIPVTFYHCQAPGLESGKGRNVGYRNGRVPD